MEKVKGKRHIGLMLLLIVASLMPLQLLADTQEDLRLSIGSKLLPSLLTADLDIQSKQGSDGTIHLLVVYQHNTSAAKNAVNKLSAISSIRNIPLTVTPIGYDKLSEFDVDSVAAVFLAESLHDDLRLVLDFAKSRKAMVFSAFEGDVERGAHGGISVRDRILPYINTSALQRDGIRLKAFFLKVAEHYE